MSIAGDNVTRLAQRKERQVPNLEVAGSNPAAVTNSSVRLAVDNTKPTREALINRAVRLTADAHYSWGVTNLGLGEVLSKVLESGDVNHFAREVKFTYLVITSPEYQRIEDLVGAGGFK